MATALVLGAPRPATGAEPAATQRFVRDGLNRATASYRLLAIGLSDIALDEQGTELAQNGWLEQRLRLMTRLDYRHPSWRFELGGDLFSGLLAGDTSAVGAGVLRYPRDAINAHQRFEPRRAMLAWRTRYGELRFGHQVSDWGYGILANSGEHEPPFGAARLGDLVERIAFVTRPLRELYVALSLDLVYRDTNADLLDGDVGINSVGAVFHRARGRFAGIYLAFRNQWDANDDRLQVLAADLHGRLDGRVAGGALAWEAGIEAVLLAGSTTRVRAEPELGSSSVLAGGGVARARLRHLRAHVGVTVEAGVASGDNNRNDDVVRHATFHPDYRVGMILFNELLAGLTARAGDRLSDPARVGQPPQGAEYLASQGGVTNALYLWPRLDYHPIANLTLRLGMLYARALADVVDPFSSNSNGGGSNRNFFGGSAASKELGLEVQLGARYALALRRDLRLGLGLDWGHLFHGQAFANARAQPLADIDRVVGRAVLDWSFR